MEGRKELGLWKEGGPVRLELGEPGGEWEGPKEGAVRGGLCSPGKEFGFFILSTGTLCFIMLHFIAFAGTSFFTSRQLAATLCLATVSAIFPTACVSYLCVTLW